MTSILYLSCHSILEYLEVSIFHELGYKVFSPGAYINPQDPGKDALRPAIPGLQYDPSLLEQFHKICQARAGEDAKYHLTKEFVDNFDIVIVMHLPDWVCGNWEAIKHKRVIWRTIGQSISNIEQRLKTYKEQGMEVVRYSPAEAKIPGHIGATGLIRFPIDPEQYQPWTGNIPQIITFAQDMKRRDQACNFTFFEETTRPFARKLYGPRNEGTADWTYGPVSYQEQKDLLRDSRIYFYTGTHPASYTLNFMESWVSGIPVVAIGPEKGNPHYFPNHFLYEIPNLITNGYDGFVSDNSRELQGYISLLMNDPKIAKFISEKGRQSAIQHFGKNMIKAAWKEYIDKGPRK